MPMNVSQNQSQSKVLHYNIFTWKEAGGKVRRWGAMIFSVDADTVLLPCAVHASPLPIYICSTVILADRIIWASLLTGWSWIHQVETMEKEVEPSIHPSSQPHPLFLCPSTMPISAKQALLSRGLSCCWSNTTLLFLLPFLSFLR